MAVMFIFGSSLNLHKNNVELGILTSHERQLFRKFQMFHSDSLDSVVTPALKSKQPAQPRIERIKNRLRIKKGQILGSCGGSVSCFNLAAIKQQKENLPDIPECFSPESCNEYAHRAGYFSDNSYTNSTGTIPEYDKDGPEVISAMQKQDKMILDDKQARELRVKQGKNAPPLKPVICGSKCFERIGAWCCRKTW
jgi:superfamily II RNA helicase